MREVTLEEIELIVGAGQFTATLTTVTITGHAPIPPGGGDPPPTGGGGSPPPPPPPPPCPQPQAPQNRVDTGFVFNHEGPSLATTGYTLPAAQFPNSGVTIGYGLDLGHQNATTLTNYGISQAGLTAVTPFFGLRGQAAVNAVTANGAPVLSAADAMSISTGALNANLSTAAGQFNAQSAIPFDQLPAQAQTVIADLAYIRPDIQGWPNFFGAITSGNWAQAVSELNNWTPSGSDSRHKDNANLLQQGISQGVLAPNPNCTP